MKEWEKELIIYRLTPAPPKENDLQKYILNYLAEKNDKYISWFLHYYERTLNEKAIAVVQDYAMYGHFLDIKQAYVIGMLKALHDYDPERGVPFIVYKEYAAMREVHEYIRSMRTGFTIQSYDEYLRLRKAMRFYREFGNKSDDVTLEKIAEAIGTSKEDAAEIIRCGIKICSSWNITDNMPMRTAKKAVKRLHTTVHQSRTSCSSGWKKRKQL